jgi:pyrroline-5-carboxylate reductase
MLNERKLAILGLGTMGQALARGLMQGDGLSQPGAIRGTVKHAEKTAALAAECEFDVGTDNAEAARSSDVLLLCTKPKSAAAVMAQLAESGALDHNPLVISVAAGVSTATLEAAAGRSLPVVRAMPNTPCRINQGMTVLSAGAHAGPEDLATAEAIVSPLGRVVRLDEEHMDAVTGLSASGPAFIYVVIEALAEGGVMVGLPRKVATELAAQCVQGAARMVLETGRHQADLKDEVTTPAGCTISALLALEDGKLRSVLARGVQEAARAAGELG